MCCISLSLYIYVYIYIYIYRWWCACGLSTRRRSQRAAERLFTWTAPRNPSRSERGEVLLRGIGTLRYCLVLIETLLVKMPICAVAA